MSTTPNDPFGNPPSAGPGQPHGQASNVWIWVLGILGVLGVGGALVCCGGGYALYRAGTGVVAEVFKQQLSGNPVIEEHIGEIKSLTMNLTKTSQESENSNGGLVFDIEGSKASGAILIRKDNSGGGTDIESAVLILADGSRHDVPLEHFGDVEDFEIDLGDVDLGVPDDLGDSDTGVPGLEIQEIENAVSEQ